LQLGQQLLEAESTEGVSALELSDMQAHFDGLGGGLTGWGFDFNC
jgi:hypothetical protein